MGKRDPAMSVLVALTGFARARSWRCGLTTSRDAPGSSDLGTEGEVTAPAPVDAKIGAFPTADILSWETGQRNDQGRPPPLIGELPDAVSDSDRSVVPQAARFKPTSVTRCAS